MKTAVTFLTIMFKINYFSSMEEKNADKTLISVRKVYIRSAEIDLQKKVLSLLSFMGKKTKATFLTLYEYAVPDLSLLKITMFSEIHPKTDDWNNLVNFSRDPLHCMFRLQCLSPRAAEISVFSSENFPWHYYLHTSSL